MRIQSFLQFYLPPLPFARHIIKHALRTQKNASIAVYIDDITDPDGFNVEIADIDYRNNQIFVEINLSMEQLELLTAKVIEKAFRQS